MKVVHILLPVLAALQAPVAAPAQDQDIVVRADVSRAEIERILNADNLDTFRLSPREVVEAMTGIPRGRAPGDFWNAYQQHVRAWQNLATVVERVQARQQESTVFEDPELVSAEAAISTTFDEVERVARSYRARIPPPRIDTRSIV